MAVKLKIKAPNQNLNNDQDDGSSKAPKIKIKPPSKIKKKQQEKGNKTRKFKINLSGDSTIDSKSGGGRGLPDNLSLIQQSGRSVPKVRVKPTRIPGDGYDSEAPDLEDDPLIESGIVIRFLNDPNLEFVHNAVESGDLTGVNVKWLSRDKALVEVNGTVYSSRLLDLPTLTELFKTVDRKNLFKAIDLAQILLVLRIVNPNELNSSTDFEIPSEYLREHPLYKLCKDPQLKISKHTFRDGLLNPYKDVYKRFRGRKLNHRVINDIESKVDELISLDDEAEETRFELVDPNSTNNKYSYVSRTPSAAPTPTPHLHSVSNEAQEPVSDDNDDIEADLEEELTKALENDDGYLESSGIMDGDHELTVKDTSIEVGVHNEGDDAQEGGATVEPDDDDEEDEDEDDEDDEGEDEEEDDDDDESKASKQQVKLLEEEVADLTKAVETHRKGYESATHKMMRMKFQTSYNTLKASLDAKKRSLAKIVNEQEQLQKKVQQTNIPSSNIHGREHDNSDQDDDQDEIADDIDDLF